MIFGAASFSSTPFSAAGEQNTAVAISFAGSGSFAVGRVADRIKALASSASGTFTSQRAPGKSVSMTASATFARLYSAARARLLNISSAGVLTRIRQVGVRRSFAEASTFSATRQAHKTVPFIETAALSLVRQIGKTLAAPGAGAFGRTSLTARSRTITFSEATNFTVTRGLGRLRNFLATGIYGAGRQPGKIFSMAELSTFASASQTTFARMLSSQGDGAFARSLSISIAKLFAAGSDHGASREVGIVRSMSSGNAFVTARHYARDLLTASTGLLTALYGHALFAALSFTGSGGLAAIWSVGIGRIMTGASSAFLTRRIGLPRWTIGAGAFTAAKALPRIFTSSSVGSFVSDRLLTLGRAFWAASIGRHDVVKETGIGRLMATSSALWVGKSVVIERLLLGASGLSLATLVSLVSGTMRKLRVAREDRRDRIRGEDRTLDIGSEE